MAGAVPAVVPVRLRDGVEIECSDGTRVVCDAGAPDGDVNVVSHAHADHAPNGPASVVCSPLTADLVRVRRDVALDRTTDDRVDLLPAGHVAGSRAALVTDPDGTRYLYTGDVCTRPRFYLDGFDPPDADVLVVEATYGDPDYVFPDHEAVAADVRAWFDAHRDRPVVLVGYALGRAQKLQVLAADAGRTVYATPPVTEVDEAIERHRDVVFPASPYEDGADLGAGDALVLPSATARTDWVERLVRETGALTAGFSGWAVDSAYRYRGGYDAAFPLSDHCDFAELRALVAAVDPDRVYVQHGPGESFVPHLESMGYRATALKRNQTSLSEFG